MSLCRFSILQCHLQVIFNQFSVNNRSLGCPGGIWCSNWILLYLVTHCPIYLVLFWVVFAEVLGTHSLLGSLTGDIRLQRIITDYADQDYPMSLGVTAQQINPTIPIIYTLFLLYLHTDMPFMYAYIFMPFVLILLQFY